LLQQPRHTLWRLLVQEYREPHRLREFGPVAKSSLEFPADGIDVVGDVGWNGMTKVGRDQRAVSLGPAHERRQPPRRVGEIEPALTADAQIDGPAFVFRVIGALPVTGPLRVTRPRACAGLQHHFGAVAPEDREGVGRVLRKRIRLEPERRRLPGHATADVGHLQNRDGPLGPHRYSRSSVLGGNISSGVTARGRIF